MMSLKEMREVKLELDQHQEAMQSWECKNLLNRESNTMLITLATIVEVFLKKVEKTLEELQWVPQDNSTILRSITGLTSSIQILRE